MESLNQLKQTLTAMLEIHQQLLDLAREKQTILMEGKLPDLQKIISKEGKLSDSIETLELRRKQQVREIFLEKGMDAVGYTMTACLKIISDALEKATLTKLTEKLREIVLSLSNLNKHNQQLIYMTLSYIQYSMNLMLPKEPSIGYGKKSAASAFKFLDAKI